MSRITISISEELARLLRREARRRRLSVSKVACQAIERHLHVKLEEEKRLPFVGIGRSGQRHVARDSEKILSAEWGDAGRR